MQYLIIATVVLGVLKLAGTIAVSWLWIFSPIVLGLAILFIVTLFFPFLAFSAIFAFGVLGILVERVCDKLECRWEKKKGRKKTEEDL